MEDKVTIELTNKSLKVQLAVAIVLLIVGGILVIATNLTTVGLVLSVLGGLGTVITKIRIWWNHE